MFRKGVYIAPNPSPMADVTLLRTLTGKSRIKFGRFADHTVDEMIISNHHFRLAHMYYYLDKITFRDDVLERIGITPSHKIKKPGKTESIPAEVISRMNQIQRDGLSEKEIMAIATRLRGIKKRAELGRERKTWHSKAYHQSINHGHKKT